MSKFKTYAANWIIDVFEIDNVIISLTLLSNQYIKPASDMKDRIEPAQKYFQQAHYLIY